MMVDTIPARAASNDAQLLKDAQRVFKALPKDAGTAEFPITPERVELGRKLFFDPRISVDGTVSCARRHQAALYGTDGLPKAKGAFDKLNDRRAPTVLNAALQFKAHWRGDRECVEDQAGRALTGPASFGNPDNASAMAKVKAIPGYTGLFQKAFHRRRRPAAADVGMLLHNDGSKRRWLSDSRRHDLIVILVDAALEIYYAQRTNP